MLIKRKSDRNLLVDVDFDSGQVKEIKRSDSKERPVPKAFFEKYSKGYLYVLASERGPVLKVNGKSYYFIDPDWHAEVEKSGQIGVFRLWQGQNLELEERYSRPNVDELDPWSDEESEDFFVWVSEKKNDAELIEMWTT